MNAPPNSIPAAYQRLTGPGPAAIAVIRIVGDACPAFIRKHLKTRRPVDPLTWQAGRVFRAELLDAEGRQLDDALVSVHGSESQWDLRLHLHGGPGVVRGCMDLLQASGFVETPEFERGLETALWIGENRIETEAYALLPAMPTLRGVQWLLGQAGRLTAEIERIVDSADVQAARERCQALLARSGIIERFTKPLRVALVGPPNVGKSTLANALADREVSLVSPTPGTTRDWLEIPGEIDGFPILWLDTAGLWRGETVIDVLAVEKTTQLISTADLVLLILDPEHAGEAPALQERLRSLTVCPMGFVLNKIDRVASPEPMTERLPPELQSRMIPISALGRQGLAVLERNVLRFSDLSALVLDSPAAFTARQVELLQTALAAGDTDFRGSMRAVIEG